jgi:hypothetical protein
MRVADGVTNYQVAITNCLLSLNKTTAPSLLLMNPSNIAAALARRKFGPHFKIQTFKLQTMR